MDIQDEEEFIGQFSEVFAAKWEEMIASSGATITMHDW